MGWEELAGQTVVISGGGGEFGGERKIAGCGLGWERVVGWEYGYRLSCFGVTTSFN